MDKYQILEQLGDGSFGSVLKAQNKETGSLVAIKKMKKLYKTWNECLALREVKALKKLNDHENIIKLREVLREADVLYFIFEYAHGNLYQKIRDQNRIPFELCNIKSFTHQMCKGLAYMHKHGFFHRDMKPENLLLVNDTIKIADFGLARETRSLPPYTDYVSTRWYRAPEILLRSTVYSSPIDIWAVGVIMAELFNMDPLFPGSTEIDQIYRICTICGTPLNIDETHGTKLSNPSKPLYERASITARNRDTLVAGGSWPDGYKLANAMNFKFPSASPVLLNSIIPDADDHALQIIADCMLFDPQKRPTALEILSHPWFQELTEDTRHKDDKLPLDNKPSDSPSKESDDLQKTWDSLQSRSALPSITDQMNYITATLSETGLSSSFEQTAAKSAMNSLGSIPITEKPEEQHSNASHLKQLEQEQVRESTRKMSLEQLLNEAELEFLDPSRASIKAKKEVRMKSPVKAPTKTFGIFSRFFSNTKSKRESDIKIHGIIK